MQVTAAMVKDLRERTGVGMMECKKFLTEAGGDLERAVELLRKAGQVKAGKRSGKTTGEGIIRIVQEGTEAVLVEINCETDFVARDGQFLAFSEAVARAIFENKPQSPEAVGRLSAEGGTVEEKRLALISKIGENVRIRRFEQRRLEGDVSAVYDHNGRIGVLVDMRGGDRVLAKDVAMHVAASRPICLSEHDAPAELIEQEKRILTEQAATSGKPADIVEKMVSGRLRKFLAQITLLGQAFVKDPDKTVAAVLKENNAEVLQFCRYELGEGLEKKQENFAEEVMAQAGTGKD